MIYNQDPCCIKAALSKGVTLSVSMNSLPSGKIVARASMPGSTFVGFAESQAIANNDFMADFTATCTSAVVDLVSSTLSETIATIPLVPAGPAPGQADVEEDCCEEETCDAGISLPQIPLVPVNDMNEVSKTAADLVRFTRIQKEFSN